MIDTSAYLKKALALSLEERRLQRVMMDILPDEIIDCHAHCNLPEHVGELDDQVMHHMMSTFPSFTLDESYLMQAIFYPKKRVRTLRFANAYRGIDHRAANEYLLGNSSEYNPVALYGIPNDIEYTIGKLADPRVKALKMYYQYFNPPAQTIFEVFPPAILDAAQSARIPIILHLPKMITECSPDLELLLTKFPKLSVVLAHLGLPHMPVPRLMSTYTRISEYSGIYMDTSMIPSAEVMFMALRTFGPDRILFGSDQTLNLIRSTVYEHPIKGQRLITEYPYHWVDPEEHLQYAHLAQGAVHTHWQVLLAIQSAVQELPIKTQRRAIESIFFNNAHQVFNI